ncbi:MAG: hypothetical protein ACK5E6_11805 [Cyanobacteriota bacterium]|jgi:hypothetical protein
MATPPSLTLPDLILPGVTAPVAGGPEITEPETPLPELPLPELPLPVSPVPEPEPIDAITGATSGEPVLVESSLGRKSVFSFSDSLFSSAAYGANRERILALMDRERRSTTVGKAGDDRIIGSTFDDDNRGGKGDDLFVGGTSTSVRAGRDSFQSGKGEDVIQLGDQLGSFYSLEGENDYLLLRDFDVTQDSLLLRGSPADYSFDPSFKVHGRRGIGLTRSNGELVALIQTEQPIADGDLSRLSVLFF